MHAADPEDMNVLIAGQVTPTNVALYDACSGGDVRTRLLPPDIAARRADVDDVVLARLDVLPTLDGIEQGLDALEALSERGVRVLNTSTFLSIAHDKYATSVALAAAALPHPRTTRAEPGKAPDLDFDPPYVVKPRFGSWGQSLYRCETGRALRRTLERLRGWRWFERGGAVVQEYVPNDGVDLRVIVAGGKVIGAIKRRAAPGEWRTNVSLGASRTRAVPDLAAQALAVSAAAAVDGDLIGVDLAPTQDGVAILEIDGCPDFTPDYVAPSRDVYTEAMLNLLEWANHGEGNGGRKKTFERSAALRYRTVAGARPSWEAR
jgi:RimK family alpha-L-glutamate ligase